MDKHALSQSELISFDNSQKTMKKPIYINISNDLSKKKLFFLKKNCNLIKPHKITIKQKSPKITTKFIDIDLTENSFYKNKISLKKNNNKDKVQIRFNCYTPRLERKTNNIKNYMNYTNRTESKKMYIKNKNNSQIIDVKKNLYDDSKSMSNSNIRLNNENFIKKEISELKKQIDNLNIELLNIHNNKEKYLLKKTMTKLHIKNNISSDNIMKKYKELVKKNNHYLNIIKIKDIIINELENNNMNNPHRKVKSWSKVETKKTIENILKNSNLFEDKIESENELENINQKKEYLKKKYEECSKEQLKKIDELNNKIMQLSVENNKLFLELKEKQTQNKILSTQIDDLNNKISIYIDEKNILQKKNYELNSSKILELNEKNILIQNLNENINKLKSENEKIISEQKETIQILNDKIINLENKIEENKNNNENSIQMEELIRIMKQNEESSQKIKEEIKKISDFELYNKKEIDKNQINRQKIAELNEIISKNEENTNKIKAQIEELMLKIINLEKKNKNLLEQLKEKENVISKLNKEIQKSENL